VPAGSVGDVGVRVLAWHVASGARVGEGQLLVEVETYKATLEIHAPSGGYVWCRGDVGDEVPAGAAICFITEDPEPPADAPAPRATQAAHTSAGGPPPARLSPVAARLAQASGLTPADFESGALIRSQDIRARVGRADGPAQASAAAVREARVRVASVPRRWERLTGRKLLGARVLADGRAASVQSAVTVPFPVAELRAKVAERRTGASATAAIIFEVARLLRQYTHFNAVYSHGDAGLYEEVNVGWALDDGDGLAVPVVRNADRKGLAEIEEETRKFAAAYVGNRLSAKELAGATFTISDLSGEGVSLFTPLISLGQSAALGLGDGTLTLGFDHQLAEGRAAARFLKDLSARLSAYGDDNRLSRLCCSVCGSGAAELKASKAFLLRCELPSRGYVCSLCISYY
jgi:pyruvate/2-oxoglutarate dehydrogenase complex dihydrolipoamide acyltransferase (E2) component